MDTDKEFLAANEKVRQRQAENARKRESLTTGMQIAAALPEKTAYRPPGARVIERPQARKCDACGCVYTPYSEADGCPTCREARRQARIKIEALRKGRTRRRDAVRSTIDRAIPKLYQGARLRNLNSNLRRLILDAMPGKSLYLCGGVGRGKTYTAAAICRWFIGMEKSASFWQWDALLLHVRTAFSESGGSELSKLHGALNDAFLVLDDVGVRSEPSEFDQSKFFSILDGRINQQLPTVITSNRPMDEIGKMYGDRVQSRLHGHFIEVRLSGRDKRRQE